jgi:hypothetical protein
LFAVPSLKQGAAIFLGLKRVEIMLASFTMQQVQHLEDAELNFWYTL